jgi:hypothetical protein
VGGRLRSLVEDLRDYPPDSQDYQENQGHRGGIDHRIEKTLERLDYVNRSRRLTHDAPFYSFAALRNRFPRQSLRLGSCIP